MTAAIPAERSLDMADREAAEDLVLQVGRALHAFGMPAHRLESALVDLAATVGIEAQFLSTPTSLLASFGSDRDGRTRLLRIEPGDAAVEKLTHLQQILDRVADGSLEPSAAARAVGEIAATPPRFGPLSLALSTALVAGPAALFVGGGWREALAGAGVGLVVGFLGLLGVVRPAVDRVLFPLAGAAAALLAAVASQLFGPLQTGGVTLAGLIVLLPGLTLTRAMSELAARHLVAGAARLAGALLVFLTLGFGIAVGNALAATWLPATGTAVTPAVPEWATWAALLLAVAGLLVQFQAHPRQLGWMVVAGFVAIAGVRLGSALLGDGLGAFLGALLVGITGNAVARWRRLPSSLVQLPGLILLVPGSIGLRSVNALVAEDTLTGVQTAFTVVLVAMSLVTGLLVANVLLPSRRAT